MESKDLIEILADVTQNNQQILRIMKGTDKIWPSNNNFIVQVDTEGVTCSISSSSIAAHSSLDETITPNTNHVVISLSITMGGEDITSTAYDDTDGSITISDVTGDVIIAVVAKEIIVFEDAAVKAICVENWGGNVIEDEITVEEAAAVTTLDGKFYGNTTITSFNEFRYFTGITSLSKQIVSGYAAGQFYNCVNLEEVTIPVANISNFNGAFRQCYKLKFLDITPTTATTYSMAGILQLSSTSNSKACTILRVPGGKITGSFYNFMNRRTGLTTIEIDGVLDLSDVTPYTGAFTYANSLSTITGTIVGIKANIGFSNSPLTRESALVILNGLQDGVSATVNFSDTTMALLTAEDIAIGTNKGWTVS